MLTTVVAYAVRNLPSVSFASSFFILNEISHEGTKFQIITDLSSCLNS